MAALEAGGAGTENLRYVDWTRTLSMELISVVGVVTW